ncbi:MULTISPECIES: YjbF family lipoprotein [unclassified Ruegeria]|uniref:YjbF family lipoprotein n=1 Tax=unclassified Ruegeria TaxID=2625375 RepID=UPI001ADAD28E|nr:MULTISPECIES: YjbF family lipoprotein [unclassified Ruegeria]MBO9411906.1 YjbF family lipoprotein [Ruegeria sp. R8_1]MBO9415533.1 YjbF family lipoprotein [Ruegeria sp. R8_2]
MKIRHVFVLGLLLVSCGEAQEDFDLLKGALQPNAPRFHPRADTLASLRPIPPRLEVGFPSRDLAGVMLLETERDGVQSWLTADGAAITLDHGMLTSAKGFGSGMSSSDVRQSAALILEGREGQAKRFHSFLNGNDEIELHAYVCQITNLGPETVLLRGNPVATTKLQENCFGIEDTFTNTYWVQNSAQRVVQSLQWTGNFLGNMFIKLVPDDT